MKKRPCKKWESKLTHYPNIDVAVEIIAKQTLRDIIAASERMPEVIWEPSLTCVNCGGCHDAKGKLDPPMDHVGKPMTEHSKYSQVLEGVARWLQARV